MKKFCPPEVEITPETDLINQLAIDSVKLLNLIMEVEDEFDISVPLNALADVQTVHELANFDSLDKVSTTMSLLDKLDAVAAARKALLPEGVEVFGTPIEEVYSSTEAKIGDRRILFLGTNNYLGLTFSPECLQAAHEAIDSEGTGTTGSRMANGSYSGHRALEREFAEFYRCQLMHSFYYRISGESGHYLWSGRSRRRRPDRWRLTCEYL